MKKAVGCEDCGKRVAIHDAVCVSFVPRFGRGFVCGDCMDKRTGAWILEAVRKGGICAVQR